MPAIAAGPTLALLSSMSGNAVARTCGFDQPELRGALLAGHNIGLWLTRYVLAIEPLASLDAPVLTDITGAQIQRILTTPLPPP